MGYSILGAVVLLALMPFIIRNQTKYRQKQIAKKAVSYGLNLDFAKKKE